MNSNSTHYLLKQLYNETEPTEKLAIEDALANNWHLKEAYNSWQELFEMLNEVKVKPSLGAVDTILKYSKATSLQAPK
jgi:hypothetical protein